MHLLDTDTLTHLHAGHPRVIERLLIASIALANNAILVTRNVRHFRQVHGVSLVNWVD
jgi:predicted nucleic acid-binding protein